MKVLHSRSCPICGGLSCSQKFPYATRFNGIDFSYLKCPRCTTVYVDPIPDSQTFAKIYAK